MTRKLRCKFSIPYSLLCVVIQLLLDLISHLRTFISSIPIRFFLVLLIYSLSPFLLFRSLPFTFLFLFSLIRFSQFSSLLLLSSYSLFLPQPFLIFLFPLSLISSFSLSTVFHLFPSLPPSNLLLIFHLHTSLPLSPSPLPSNPQPTPIPPPLTGKYILTLSGLRGRTHLRHLPAKRKVN